MYLLSAFLRLLYLFIFLRIILDSVCVVAHIWSMKVNMTNLDHRRLKIHSLVSVRHE